MRGEGRAGQGEEIVEVAVGERERAYLRRDGWASILIGSQKHDLELMVDVGVLGIRRDVSSCHASIKIY